MRNYTEQIIWGVALLFLFFLDTTKQSTSLCVFRFLGFKSCPGCGIGHSVHYALHLNFVQAFKEHVLGIPATFIILFNIFKPLFTKIKLTWINSKCL